MKHVVTLLAVLLLLFGCSDQSEFGFPDASFGDSGGPTQPTFPPECQPELVASDYYHCGECGHRCPSADADRCLAGVCRCGLDLACTDPLQDCRAGRCVTQDPEGIVCEFDEECTVNEACIVGRCTWVECVPEVCDGADNDCDGFVDNVGDGPLSQFCVGDMPADAMVFLPPCRQGVRVCLGGEWTECTGDIEPVEEVGVLGCDGVDNNCDGCVDGVSMDGVCESREPEAFDVLFVIDQSGSMTNKIDIVRQAVRLFSTRLSTSTAFRWGIIRVPGPIDGRAELYLDLSPFPVFSTSLSTMSAGSGGSEPQWDAIYEAVLGVPMPRPGMGLGPVSWREGSVRIIILFTDEQGQTTRARRALPPTSETIMCDAMTHGEVFIPVVTATHQSDFDDCAYRSVTLPAGNAGSGDACSADADCEMMETCEVSECVTAVVVSTAAELDVVISEPCGGGM